MTPLKVLVAEDFDGFRAFVCDQFRQHDGFDVTAVADGIAAVDAARTMRPDLALLDIGLPGIDGLAAAARIRTESPGTAIVFLTQESSPDVVDAALRLGAHGYVVKTRAQRWMMPTVEAILARTAAAGEGLQDGRRGTRPAHAHRAQFFADRPGLVNAAGQSVRSAIDAGDAAIVVLGRPDLATLQEQVSRREPSVAAAIQRGTFLALDSADVLAGIGAGSDADWATFHTAFREMIAKMGAATGRPQPRVVVFGEIASLAFTAGHFGAVLRLEQIGHELVADAALPGVDLTCAYALSPATAAAPFTQICAAHAAVAVR